MSHIWEHSKERGSRLLMLLAIGDFADDFGIAYPGVKRLAKKTRMTERNAQLTLRALELADELLIESGKGAHTGHGNTNRYHLVQYQNSIDFKRDEAGFTPKSNGVKAASPQGMKRTSPQGVKAASPKPSVELSEQPPVTPAGDDSRPTIFTLYEQNIGLLTPMAADSLKDIAAEFPADWIPEAFKIAVEANARKLNYVRGVLDRWKRDGRGALNSHAKADPLAGLTIITNDPAVTL